MAMDMTTPISDIIESLRAIKVAASERHTALLQEMQELEAAFPDLAVATPKTPRASRRGAFMRTAEQRAQTSVRMKAAWAKRKAANGAEAVQ